MRAFEVLLEAKDIIDLRHGETTKDIPIWPRESEGTYMPKSAGFYFIYSDAKIVVFSTENEYYSFLAHHYEKASPDEQAIAKRDIRAFHKIPRIKDAHKVGESQSNINTFIRKFLNEKGEVNDYAGYHKAIYAAQNVDTIAQHFYDQGKADATKNIMKQSKNIDEKPRQAPEDVYVGGWKVRAVTDGTDLSKLRIKKPQFNKNN